MIILNEIHSDKMEFLIYALKTHTFKVLIANEDEWRPSQPFLLMYVTRN